MTLNVSLSQTFEAYSIGLHSYLIFLSMSVFFHWKRPKETENERALFSLTLPHQLSRELFPFFASHSKSESISRRVKKKYNTASLLFMQVIYEALLL